MTATVTLNGISIGDCGSDYVLAAPHITGLGIPEVKATTDLDRYGYHGYVAGRDFLGQRALSFPITIFRKEDPTLAMQFFRSLKGAWRPTGPAEDLLEILLPGYGPADDVIRFYGRPRSAIEVELGLHHTGLINCLASFTALDPVGYGPEEVVALPAGPTVVTNPGDAETDRATIALTGVTSISTTAYGATRTISFTAAVTGTLDLRNQTLVNGSGVDIFSQVKPESVWFGLRSGANTITVSGGSATMTFRGGWW